jgi:hypothetical protein
MGVGPWYACGDLLCWFAVFGVSILHVLCVTEQHSCCSEFGWRGRDSKQIFAVPYFRAFRCYCVATARWLALQHLLGSSVWFGLLCCMRMPLV